MNLKKKAKFILGRRKQRGEGAPDCCWGWRGARGSLLYERGLVGELELVGMGARGRKEKRDRERDGNRRRENEYRVGVIATVYSGH
jgi:hypothetical protein